MNDSDLDPAHARRTVRAQLHEPFDAGLYAMLARVLYFLSTQQDKSPDRGTDADMAAWITSHGRHAKLNEIALERGVEGGAAAIRRLSKSVPRARRKKAH
jgi:hypothetical protein